MYVVLSGPSSLKRLSPGCSCPPTMAKPQLQLAQTEERRISSSTTKPTPKPPSLTCTKPKSTAPSSTSRLSCPDENSPQLRPPLVAAPTLILGFPCRAVPVAAAAASASALAAAVVAGLRRQAATVHARTSTGLCPGPPQGRRSGCLRPAVAEAAGIAADRMASTRRGPGPGHRRRDGEAGELELGAATLTTPTNDDAAAAAHTAATAAAAGPAALTVATAKPRDIARVSLQVDMYPSGQMMPLRRQMMLRRLCVSPNDWPVVLYEE